MAIASRASPCAQAREKSSSESSARQRISASSDSALAFGDIFGGNAFPPVLFLVASLLSGQAVVPQAQVTDIYLTGLGALLSVVYMFGIVFRTSRTIAHVGLDSALIISLYLLGMAGLVAIGTS